jgi:hypothetical protein
MTLICLGCDREYEGPLNRGFCVVCTIENFKVNGIKLSISEVISIGDSICKHPELIVRLAIKR